MSQVVMQTNESLGVRVRRLRGVKGLSQADLATDGVSASYVSLIESGRREPTASTVAALAQKLDTTPEFLLTGAEPLVRKQVQLDLSYAELVLRNGDPAEALSRYTEVLDGLSVTEERAHWRTATWGVARCHESLGDASSAIGVLEDLRRESGPDDSEPTWVNALVDLARCYRVVGDLSLAIAVAEDAMTTFDALGNPGGAAEIDLAATLMSCYYARGDWAKASSLSDEIITRAEAAGSPRARGAAYWNASVIAQVRGERGLALELASQAVALFNDSDAYRNQAMVRVHRAWIMLSQDGRHAEEALALLRPVETSLEELGDSLPLAYCRLQVARALLHQGQPDEADTLAHLAEAVFIESDSLQDRVSALVIQAQAMIQMSRRADARAALGTAKTLLLSGPTHRLVASSWIEVAREYEALGDASEALSAYRRGASAAGIQAPPQPPRRAAATVDVTDRATLPQRTQV